MANKTFSERRFHVGEQVRFLLSVKKTTGTVIEDRGPIGIGGRRLYRIRFQFSPDEEPMFTELSAADLEPANGSSKNSIISDVTHG